MRIGLLLAFSVACGAPRPAVEAARDEAPPRESGTAEVQARVAERIVEARERGVPSDRIRERWLSDTLVVLTIADADGPAGSLVWPGGERALEREVLYVSRDDGACEGQGLAPAALTVDDERPGVAIVRGGDHALLITPGPTPRVSAVACPDDVEIEASVCGEVVTCRRDGALRSVAGRWREGALTGDPCAAALDALASAFASAPERMRAAASRAAADVPPAPRPRCSRPSSAEIGRAREAIERLLAATPPDPEGAEVSASPADLEAALREIDVTCRHPRSHSFAIILEDARHHSVWWVTDEGVSEIARTRVEEDGALVSLAVTRADLDGDRVEDVGVHASLARPTGSAGNCARARVACTSTFLSGASPEPLRVDPCLPSIGLGPAGPVVFGDAAQPFTLRDGALVPLESGLDALRAHAVRAREAPEIAARWTARLVGDAPAALECADVASLREDLEQRFLVPGELAAGAVRDLAECP